MPSERKIKPGFGLEAFIVAPMALCVCVFIGAAYGFIDWLHDWGIANLVVVVAQYAALIFVMIMSIRFAKVRGEGLGALYGSAHAAACVLGALGTAWLLTGNGRGFFELQSVRMAAGQTLFGAGSWSLKGWLLGACWIASNGLLLLFGLGVGVTESSRPFCDSCKRWANRVAWKATMQGVTAPEVAGVKQAGLPALLELRPGQSGGETLHLHLRTCRCGAIASLLAERQTERGSPNDAVIDRERISVRQADTLFDWSERQPGVSARPRPSLDRMKTAGERARQPFAADPTPPNGEHRATGRWEKRLGASDSYANNDFTKELRRLLGEGDFRAIDEALAMLTDNNDRANVLEAAADWSERQYWLEDWEEHSPQCPTRLSVEGIWAVKEAWIARGSGWVPQNFGEFRAHLERATDLLSQASAVRPSDPVPLAWMIYAAKGMETSLEDTFEICKRAVKADRACRLPYSFFLDAATPKWGGSRDKMMSFARTAMRSAPQGSTVPVVIAEAHLEMAGDIAREQDDEAAFEQYFKQPDVVADLVAANAHCFAPHRATMDTARTRVYFAYALWKAGRHDLASEHLRIIGKSTPYGPFASRLAVGSKDTVARARKDCGLG